MVRSLCLLPSNGLGCCREREHAHANHQSLLGDHNDRHKKHQARSASPVHTATKGNMSCQMCICSRFLSLPCAFRCHKRWYRQRCEEACKMEGVIWRLL